MSATSLNHIAWSKIEPQRHAFNLAESGVDPPDLEALGLPSHGGLPAAGYALLPELERTLGARWGAPGGRVLLTAGGSEANALVFAALLGRGEEVLVESPGYEPHREAPRLFDITVRRFERPLAGAGPSLASAIEAALAPATRMVVLTHLHNPSGDTLAPDDAQALCAMAERRGVWLLCDEVFRDVDSGRPGTIASLGERCVATSSLTKVYGLGGLRIGWIAAAAEVLDRCAAVQNGLTVNPALPSIALALELTPHLDTLRARTHRILAANRARWDGLLARGVPFTVPVTARGTTAWGLFPCEGQGDAFAAFASERFSLAVAPGRFFAETRGIRVGLAAEPAGFAAALDTFERAVDAFAAGAPVGENA
jgi:aspartate/methionine/tyrosine aminotransferase